MTGVRWRERAKSRYIHLKSTEGLTQAKLAEQVGVTQGAVAHWLGGRRVPETLEQYEALAMALKMHPAELLYGLDPELSKTFDRFDANQRTQILHAINVLADVN